MMSSARNITLNTIKKLYALSGNKCANPDCQRELVKDGTLLGEIAHICAANPNGPRYDLSMTDDERRGYSNLILLCGDCNKIIDDNPDKYPVGLLREWKQKHESRCQDQFEKTQNAYLKRLECCPQQDVGVEENSFFDIKLINGKNEKFLSKHVLSSYILTQIEQYDWNSFKNLIVKGVAGIGKSTEMKYAYNSLIDIFSDKNKHQKYQFCPYPIYFELKNFQDDLHIPLDIENTIVFLDGFDELSECNIVKVEKEIGSIKSSHLNVRFVIAGRDASFDHEFIKNSFCEELRLSYEVNLEDENDRKLYYQYLNTPLFSLVFIPFYKNRALQEEYKGIKNLKQFVETIIEGKLKDDKKRKDYAEGFSGRQTSSSKIDFKKLKSCLADFCYQLNLKGVRHFSEKDILESFNNDDISECFLKSSLIEEHEDKLSFVSNIYYEYFLALYFSVQKFSVIRSKLFLSNGKAKVQEIVVISMLLNILNNKCSLYKKIVNQLSKQSSAYVLLTDYVIFPAKNRFGFYKKILEEYNNNKSLIYYLHFRSSHNILANIGSLSDSLIELLPEEFKSDAIEYHRKQVDTFLKNPQKKNLVVFANSIILLGLHNRKIWNREQQKVLKELSIPIIQFFLQNPLAKELDGLLSFEIVLYWYLEYGWADCFSQSDWLAFLEAILPHAPNDFYIIGDELDFKVKLVIFNLFHKNPVVLNLVKSLTIRILNTQFDNGSAGFVPSSIDDDYEGHPIHVNQDVVDFSNCMKELDLACEEILGVFNESSIENSIYKVRSTERDDVFDGLWILLNKSVEKFGSESLNDLYKFVKRYLDDGHFMFQDQVRDFCSKLNADVKIALLRKILEDNQFVAGENTWYHCSAIIELLDNGNIELSKEILEQIKSLSTGNYKLIVRNIAYQKEEHLLKTYCIETISAVDPVFVKQRTQQVAAIEKFEHDKQEMFAKEVGIICDKHELLKEIGRISKYVEKMISDGNYRSAWDILHGMELATIEHNVKWPYKEKYIKDVFSEFAIKFLKREKFLKENLIDQNAVNREINACFASESVFWRYIYIYCLSDKKTEAAKQFLLKNNDVVERIKKSMQIEVSEIVKQSVGAFFDVQNINNWMEPFLYYTALLYDSKIPDWFDKNKISDFVICVDIYHELHELKPGIFSFKSIFEWLEKQCGVAKTELIGISIKCYEDVDIDSIRSEIIYFLSDVNNENAIDFVIKQTKKVVAEEADHCEVQYALAHYWRSAKFEITDEIASFIPFEKFIMKSEDSTSDLNNALIDYFCENASVEQKKECCKKISTLEGPKKKELLRNLGDEYTISCAIDEYISGANVKSYLNHSLYKIKILDDKLFGKFISLYEYSIEMSNERRGILGNWALCVIKENTTVMRYKVLKKRIGRIIVSRKESGGHWEGLQDFLDEIEQKLYDNPLDEKFNQSIKCWIRSIPSLYIKRVYAFCMILSIVALIICIPAFGWNIIEPIAYIVGLIGLIISWVLCFKDGKLKSPFQRIEEYFG